MSGKAAEDAASAAGTLSGDEGRIVGAHVDYLSLEQSLTER